MLTQEVVEMLNVKENIKQSARKEDSCSLGGFVGRRMCR